MYDEYEDNDTTAMDMFRFMRRFSMIGNFTLPVAFIFGAASPLLGQYWWIAMLLTEAFIGAGWVCTVALTKFFSMGIAANEGEDSVSTLKDDCERLAEYERAFWLALIKALRIQAILAFLTRVIERVNTWYAERIAR